MIVINRRLSLLVLAVAVVPLQDARAQPARLQGAWLEEGSSCASVFVATPNGVAFKRPASAFAPAFIIAGRRLSTPLASCRFVSGSSNGERQVIRLSCTTSVTTETAHAVLAPAEDGSLYRYHSVEGGLASKYQRCSRDALKAPRAASVSGNFLSKASRQHGNRGISHVSSRTCRGSQYGLAG